MIRFFIFQKCSPLLTLVLLVFYTAEAQLPQCDKVYLNLTSGLTTSDTLLIYDPALPVSNANPSINTISLPSNNLGLAVSPVLGSGNNTLTYYTTSGGTFWFYDPLTAIWVNTGDSIGPSTNVNIAAGGGHIYTMRGFGSFPGVYKYDGTGNAIFLVSVNAPRPYDLIADCEGNFYVITLLGPVWSMTKYSSAGTILQGYTVNNSNNYFLSGGLGVLGNTFYADDNNSKGIAQGILGGSTLNFNTLSVPVPILQSGFNVNDMATCPGALNNLAMVTITPGDTSVCSGTTLTFTATATNTGANLQFQWFVDGLPIPGAISGNFTFTPTADCDVNVEIVTDGTCAQMTVSSPLSHITLSDSDTISIVIPATACAGDTIQVSVSGPAGSTVIWDFGTGNVLSGSGVGPYLVSWPLPGQYEVGFETTAAACNRKDTAQITIGDRPELYLSTSTEGLLCIGDTIQVLAVTDSSNILAWLPGSGYQVLDESAMKASILLEGNGMVMALATGSTGCSATASLPVMTGSCCRLLMPNAFSPNGDNLNDRFGPVNNGHLRIVLLNIYNRWGQMVYNNVGGRNSYWDGSYGNIPLDAGTYFYVIKYSCDYNTASYEKRGDLTLIR